MPIQTFLYCSWGVIGEVRVLELKIKGKGGLIIYLPLDSWKEGRKEKGRKEEEGEKQSGNSKMHIFEKFLSGTTWASKSKKSKHLDQPKINGTAFKKEALSLKFEKFEVWKVWSLKSLKFEKFEVWYTNDF